MSRRRAETRPAKALANHARGLPLHARRLTPLLVALGLAGCPEPKTAKHQLLEGDCGTCHLDEQDLALNPPHVELAFPANCGMCHEENTWAKAPKFEHSKDFPLTFSHADQTCATCHAGGYRGVSNECASCHSDRAAEVMDPDHSGLPTDCFACHRTDSFSPAHFVHAWPLEGKHELAPCSSCHYGKPAKYEGLSSACLDCHDGDRAYADKKVPGHSQNPTDCTTCHNFNSFAM